MALSEATLKKLSKDEVINLVLDYQSKFDFTLARISNELSDLKKDFGKLGSDLSVARQVNSLLRERVTSLERQCWSNSQYSRRECLELTDILETSDNNTLERTVLKIFEKLEVNVDPSNVEDCHWISSKNGPKRVIVKVSKRKGVSKLRSSKRKLKDMDLTSIGINNPIYINDSLCTYYKMHWRKCKSLRSNKLIHSFWVTNGSIRLRTVDNGRTNVITHANLYVSLMRFFP